MCSTYHILHSSSSVGCIYALLYGQYKEFCKSNFDSLSCFLMTLSETELVWKAGPADISMREPLSMSWADPCTWLTPLSGPALCSASPTPGLSPPVHKLPAQVTAFASPSSSCVTRPLASSSLLLQHSVDCLTHRKRQANISCTELISCGSTVAPAAVSLRWSHGWQPLTQTTASQTPSQWIWASPLWRPLTKIFYSV